MERYLHVDGQQIGIIESLSFIQSLQNNNLKNILRMALETTGCIGDGFSLSVEGAGSGGPVAIFMKVGSIIFPNGEMFAGKGFRYQIPVEPMEEKQYLLVSYQPLRQHHAHYAPGFGAGSDNYFMRRDGLKWRLVPQSSFTYQGLNEVLIGTIFYSDDGSVDIVDRRSIAIIRYNTDPLYEKESVGRVSADSSPQIIYPDKIFSKIVRGSISPANRECLNLIRLSWAGFIGEHKPRHYTQSRFIGGHQTQGCIFTSRMPIDFLAINVPVLGGATYTYSSRLIDRNRPSISSEWLDDKSILGGGVGPLDSLKDPPILRLETSTVATGVRILASLGLDSYPDISPEFISSSYLQIWAKDGGRSVQVRPSQDPVFKEVHALSPESTLDTAEIPHQIFFPSPSSSRVVVGARIVFPGQRVSQLATAVLERNEEYVQSINFGLHYEGDSNVETDAPPGPPWSWNFYQHSHQRWGFSNGTDYYVATFPCQSTDGYLVGAEFENHHVDALSDVGTLVIDGFGDSFNLSIGAPSVPGLPYTSYWSSEVGLPIVGETKLRFKLVEGAAPPINDWINVCGRLRLTFRVGTE